LLSDKLLRIMLCGVGLSKTSQFLTQALGRCGPCSVD